MINESGMGLDPRNSDTGIAMMKSIDVIIAKGSQ
jgi:hypothetical protein